MSARLAITDSELVAELRASVAPDAPPDALTMAELAQQTGLGKTSIKDYLRTLREDGRLEVFRARRADASGRTQIVPAYRIKPRKPTRG